MNPQRLSVARPTTINRARPDRDGAPIIQDTEATQKFMCAASERASAKAFHPSMAVMFDIVLHKNCAVTEV